MYISGVPDFDEQVVRVWANRNGVPLHVFVTLFSRMVIAQSWTEQIFKATEGTDFLEGMMEQLVKEPGFEKIRKSSVVELISGYRFKPVFRRDIEEINAHIEAAKARGEEEVPPIVEDVDTLDGEKK